MNEEELKEIFKELELQGLKPELCDTPVPYFKNGVPAGYPDSPGDYDGDYEMIPKSLLKRCDFIVTVRGESMRDANIENGDDVIVKKTNDYSDGDIVVAFLDGETTLKAIAVMDDETWLVPANEAYNAIRLSEYQNVYILGKVTGIRKDTPRMSYEEMQKRLRATKRRRNKVVTDEMVRDAVSQVLCDIKVSRMWFCIYRVLVDVGYLDKGYYEGLKLSMDRLFPDNDFSINPRDISRMDVDSFSKSIDLWNELSAPVTGKRYREYLQLARDLTTLLNL